jgi:hypothetical protein
MLRIDKLTKKELFSIVNRIHAILWGDDQDEQWSPDTLDLIAEVFQDRGLSPE